MAFLMLSRDAQVSDCHCFVSHPSSRFRANAFQFFFKRTQSTHLRSAFLNLLSHARFAKHQYPKGRSPTFGEPDKQANRVRTVVGSEQVLNDMRKEGEQAMTRALTDGRLVLPLSVSSVRRVSQLHTARLHKCMEGS